VAAAVIGLLKLTSRLTARQHEQFGPQDVEAALKKFVSPMATCCCEDWVLFLACPIGDPRLEAVRQECLRIVQQNPAEYGPEAKAKVAEILDRLRRHA
jgi:hypothetical protein